MSAVLVGQNRGAEVHIRLRAGVAAQIKICAVGDALNFLESQRRIVVHQIIGALGIVREVRFWHVQNLNLMARNTYTIPPFQPRLEPLFMPYLVLARFDKKLDFHLLKFTHPKNEIARRNLVAKRFTNLGDTKRKPSRGAIHHILKVHKNALSGFRAQVGVTFVVGHRTHRGPEHHVKRSGRGPVGTCTAFRLEHSSAREG